MNHLHFLVLQSQFSPNYTSFKNCRILCPFSGQMVCAEMAIHKNSKDCRQKEYLLLDQLLQLGGGGEGKAFRHTSPLKAFLIFSILSIVLIKNITSLFKSCLSSTLLPLQLHSNAISSRKIIVFVHHFSMCFSSKLLSVPFPTIEKYFLSIFRKEPFL